MKNKFLKVVLCTFLCLTVASTSVFADDNESAKFSFKDFVTGLVEAKVDSYKESVKDKIEARWDAIKVNIENNTFSLKEINSYISEKLSNIISNIDAHVGTSSASTDVILPTKYGNVTIGTVTANVTENVDGEETYGISVPVNPAILNEYIVAKIDGGKVGYTIVGDTLYIETSKLGHELTIEYSTDDGTGSETAVRHYSISTASDLEDHNWDKGVEITPATCTEKGSLLKTCKTCGKTETVEIAALKHKYDRKNPVSEVPATCVTDGSVTYKCTRCGETKTEVIKATGEHKYISVDNVPATCTEDGHNGGWICEDCGYTLGCEKFEATGHTYVYTKIDGTWHTVTCSKGDLTPNSEKHVYDETGICVCGAEKPSEN